MSDITMLYRLIVLYMLRESREPVSNTQITIFMLDKEYTGFFTIQDAIADLVDAKLIDPVPVEGNTYYYINRDGRAALAPYEAKISPQIKADIRQFLKFEDKQEDRENTGPASYTQNKDGSCQVVCDVRSGEQTAMTVSLQVANQEQAAAICRNWKQNHIELYTNLMYDLLK